MSCPERAVHDLSGERDRSCTVIRALEAEVTELKNLAHGEKTQADHAKRELRLECEALRAQLAKLAEEHQHLRLCQSSDLEMNRCDAEALQRVRTEKLRLETQNLNLETRLKEALHLHSSAQDEGDQLRLQLLHLHVESERNILKDRLAQCEQELDARSQHVSALLMEKEEVIRNYEADLARSREERQAALESERDLQARLDDCCLSLRQLRAELHLLRQENEQKDAIHSEIDDERYDREVALENDHRALEIAQKDLMNRSQDAEARSEQTENLLSEVLAQMAKEREEYRLTLSTRPEADFYLLGMLALRLQ